MECFRRPAKHTMQNCGKTTTQNNFLQDAKILSEDWSFVPSKSSPTPILEGTRKPARSKLNYSNNHPTNANGRMRKMPLTLASAASVETTILPLPFPSVVPVAPVAKITSPALTTAAALRKTVKTPLDFLLLVLLSPNVVVAP